MHYKLFLKNLSKTLLVKVGYLPMSGEADELADYAIWTLSKERRDSPNGGASR